ncbi:MAG: FMN-binding glutamate synthase family protein, partial [Chlorobi bacterium]|nr:FMN-binding glutamate synthase family protein [Chlorobiota bacterium]
MNSLLDFLSHIPLWLWIIIVLIIIIIRDIIQRHHSINHNFPLIGHFRYMLEKIGPELRQYLVANNREELPFNRIERSWIYASAKHENNYEGFGTDRDIYAHQHIFINNAMMPFQIGENHPNAIDHCFLPCAKVIGFYNKRQKPFRPASIINVSAMSFGSLSAKAIESLNKGVKIAGAYHNTGEGGLSPYHSNGGDVIFQ